jgi:hypothetical protein
MKQPYHWSGWQVGDCPRRWTWRIIFVFVAAFWITLIRWLLP